MNNYFQKKLGYNLKECPVREFFDYSELMDSNELMDSSNALMDSNLNIAVTHKRWCLCVHCKPYHEWMNSLTDEQIAMKLDKLTKKIAKKLKKVRKKKVLLRERKRHTAHCIASIHSVSWGGGRGTLIQFQQGVGNPIYS